MGHQHGVRRHEDLRGDAAARAAVLHPQRRHHLRRRSDSRVGRRRETARCGTTSSRRRSPRWRRRSTNSADAIATTCSTRTCAASTPRCRRSGSGTITRSPTTGPTRRTSSADARYTEKNVPLLIARGARAFLEYAPMRPFDARESQRVYRRYSYGPLLDLFVLDMRSYRGPNTANLQTTPSEQTAFLGREQLDWLKDGSDELARRVESDRRGHADRTERARRDDREGLAALGSGRERRAWRRKGRELEFVELLALSQTPARAQRRLAHGRRSLLRRALLRSVARRPSATSTASGSSSPARSTPARSAPARSTARSGRRSSSSRRRPPGQANLSPYSGLQFFGEVNIDAQSRATDGRPARHQRHCRCSARRWSHASTEGRRALAAPNA